MVIILSYTGEFCNLNLILLERWLLPSREYLVRIISVGEKGAEKAMGFLL